MEFLTSNAQSKGTADTASATTKVYSVVYWMSYECNNVVGVFTSKADAITHAKYLFYHLALERRERYGSGFTYSRWWKDHEGYEVEEHALNCVSFGGYNHRRSIFTTYEEEPASWSDVYLED